ncbi:hypothetical protein K505DRAFT_369218 [Melanomma pulvis-pyrius CBS 109.77]|uniref:Uncharacterized protein n=1 Tax=Melanomma pulvis-pyrius CBS 109.77 TaxID=1314802 RepID=A0A6A6WN34_9PLEO|nr:hypothetical protein K505DRAFT_369218 [Melanomma pulvis-pyrius CBS 109.77]
MTTPAEELAYVMALKPMILSDARALYSAYGLTSRKATFDVMTSRHLGAYQASLIMYPDLDDSTHWTMMFEGLRCTNMGAAMKMLWDGIQTGIGEVRDMQLRLFMCPPSTTAMTPSAPTPTGEDDAASVETPKAAASPRSSACTEFPVTEKSEDV